MPTSPRGARSPVLVVVLVLLVLVVGAAVYLRSRDDDQPSAAELAERQRTCARLLTFSSLAGDPGLTPAAPTATVHPASVANLFSTMGADVDLLVGTAPSNVKNDVRTMLEALRAQAEDPGAARPVSYEPARQRLASFLNGPESGCQSGTDPGSG